MSVNFEKNINDFLFYFIKLKLSKIIYTILNNY